MYVITKNLNETLKLGQRLAKCLRGGDVVGFSGELGAGKTVLIKGLAKGLGIKKIVRSPSFNLMRVYHFARPHRDIKTLAHLDCYRLTSPQEAVDIGLLDYLADKKTLTVIEWPERIKKILPKNRTKLVRLKILGESERRLTLPFDVSMG
jgi:tRNA threonylcarbamoyladenosine biosynthesis protein TsaE